MKLILKNLKQVEYEIFIESAKITVKELKKEIEQLYSFDSEQIKLIFNGTILENDKTLEEYEIKENSHVIMMNTKTKILKNESKSKPVEFQENKQQIKPQIDQNKPNISQILSDNWTIQVNSLIDMGFERSQVEAAVKAANGRIDLAVEYLNNGIPDNKANNSNRNRKNNNQRQRNKEDITKELKKQAGVIKMLCKDNKFRLFEILNNIKYNDTGLMRLITDYRNDFKNYLDSPITEEDKQNYEKIEAEADKIQQERKEKKEKEKKEKEEKEKEEKEKKDKEEKEEKEKEEKEVKEDKNEETKEVVKDDNNSNKEEIAKEEKNENKMEKEKEEIKENKESNIPGENMEDKKEEKEVNKNNDNEIKKDDNKEIEEKKENLEDNNNENKQENFKKKEENENKMEVIEEKKEEKKEIIEENKKEEKISENKDKEITNNKLENNGNSPLINQLTDEEKEAVNRIKSLCDFSFQTVAEAYIVCNKNEELTANYLFENM